MVWSYEGVNNGNKLEIVELAEAGKSSTEATGPIRKADSNGSLAAFQILISNAN